MLMNIGNQSKNVFCLDTEQDTVMGPLEKDFKDLDVTEKLLSLCKTPEFFPCFPKLPFLY